MQPFPQLRLDLVKQEPEEEEPPAASSSDAWRALENELLAADIDDNQSAEDYENLDIKKNI